jgi:hypothetical protein
MKRALGVEKGDLLPLGGAFSVEVEVFEYLRRHGFVDPRVAVTATPPTADADAVHLAVEIEPGPRVSFRFAGDRPPRRLRESITTLYRPEPFEVPTFREMEAQTVRVFRSRGHLDAQVSVEARPAGAEDAPFDRVVVITSQAGSEVALAAPRFQGLPGEESDWIARRFWGPVQRAELALGLPAADERASGDARPGLRRAAGARSHARRKRARRRGRGVWAAAGGADRGGRAAGRDRSHAVDRRG